MTSLLLQEMKVQKEWVQKEREGTARRWLRHPSLGHVLGTGRKGKGRPLSFKRPTEACASASFQLRDAETHGTV